jgi:hypothetical protein
MAAGIPGTLGVAVPTMTDDGRLTVATRPHYNDKDWPDFWADRGDDLGAVPPNRMVSMGQDMRVAASAEGDQEIVFRFCEPIQVRGGHAWLLTPFNKSDFASVELFTAATPVAVNSEGNGNCNLVPTGAGFNIIVPAAGDGFYDLDLDAKIGNSNVHQAAIVPAPAGDGFYDYDSDTNVISPNTNSPKDGGYNLYDQEIKLQRFLNHVRIREEMTEFLGQEAKVVLPHWSWRVILHHGPGTHESEICFRLVMYRQTSY